MQKTVLTRRAWEDLKAEGKEPARQGTLLKLHIDGRIQRVLGKRKGSRGVQKRRVSGRHLDDKSFSAGS
jgi:hypothetical protein